MKHCEACNGTGWIQTWRGEYSGVKRCVCNPKPSAPAEPAKKPKVEGNK